MRIGLTSGMVSEIPKRDLQTKNEQTKQPPQHGDRVELGVGLSSSLGAGNSYGSGVVGRFMKWTARELPTDQTPLGEEEKQRILDKLQPGDVVLTYHSGRPNLGHLAYLTTGSHYTHCAIYEGYGRIIETVGDSVTRSQLIDRLDGPLKVAVVRPPYKSFRDRGEVIQQAKDLIGRKYDYRFDNRDESELYCSEFIEVAMKKVDPDLQVPNVSFLGRKLTAPDAFAKIDGVKLVHDGRSNYWSNQKHQSSLYLGAAAGAGLGAALGGAVGGTLGAAVGTIAGAFVGYEGALSLSS